MSTPNSRQRDNFIPRKDPFFTDARGRKLKVTDVELREAIAAILAPGL